MATVVKHQTSGDCSNGSKWVNISYWSPGPVDGYGNIQYSLDCQMGRRCDGSVYNTCGASSDPPDDMGRVLKGICGDQALRGGHGDTANHILTGSYNPSTQVVAITADVAARYEVLDTEYAQCYHSGTPSPSGSIAIDAATFPDGEFLVIAREVATGYEVGNWIIAIPVKSPSL